MTSDHAVIIGAGAAGLAAAGELIRSGWPGRITIVEPATPINRTLVTKGVLPGLLTATQAARTVPPGVDLVDDEAIAVDPGPVVRLRSGVGLGARLVLIASGSRPRGLAASGPLAAADRLTTMHSTADAERVRALLPADDPRAIVLGAGLVGSETASVLAEAGVHVTLVSNSVLPMCSRLGPEVASSLADLHRRAVHTRFGRRVADIAVGPAAIRIELDRGERVHAHVAIVAHGTVPMRPRFLGAADGAIAVDGRMRTAVPGVYAAGGAAAVRAGASEVRVDHWADAEAQGRHAARAMLHDLLDAPDPGGYRFDATFSSRIHGATLSGWGVAHPGIRWTQPLAGVAMSVGAVRGEVVTAVGIDAGAAVREAAVQASAGSASVAA
ncbi:FAD-dependent oxidoreductase [Agromyces aurantiacus]|uniref:FAD-dependent oxidoreductase n=1 Tax=Agromyces aurantiacus TaxID=165814 RepID=A0ABV9R2B8_9MICO|nr:FAD-dependent oxidoreductase [Agromyces aurantiacus]MBM7502945.1 NADPH-dependent 2,4-dienoyl-CoA reductase/sulfur reductase-like enzyme [Agromyces aurantiacus]